MSGFAGISTTALKRQGFETRAEAYRLMALPDFWTSLRPIAGAQDAVSLLMDRYKVFFVTAPWWYCTTWLDQRRRWLERTFILSSSTVKNSLVTASDKRFLSADFFVDDKAKNISNWRCHNDGHALLFKNHHNSYSDLIGFDNWCDGVRMILEFDDNQRDNL